MRVDKRKFLDRREISLLDVTPRTGELSSRFWKGKFKGTPMRELGRLYEMTMKFRTIARTRHAGRRARSRQIIKQHGTSRSEGIRGESVEKQRGEVKRGTGELEGDAGKFPPTSRRFRPAAFPGRVP